jgi:hypothetical protein
VPATSWQHHRARIAAKRRHHGPDAAVEDDLQAMREAQAEEHVRRLLHRFSPTAEQRARLAVIVLGGGDAA